MRKLVLVIVGLTLVLMGVQKYLTRGRKKDSSHVSAAGYLPWVIITLLFVLNVILIHDYKTHYGLAVSLPKTSTKADNPATESNSAHGSTTIEIYNTKPQSSSTTAPEKIPKETNTTNDDVGA